MRTNGPTTTLMRCPDEELFELIGKELGSA